MRSTRKSETEVPMPAHAGNFRSRPPGLRLPCAGEQQLYRRIDLGVVVPRRIRREQRARHDIAKIERDDGAGDRLRREVRAQLLALLVTLDRIERVLPHALLPDGD